MFCSRRVEQLSSIPHDRPIVLDGSNNNPINSVDDAVDLFNIIKGAPSQNKYLIKEAIQNKYIASSNNGDDTTKKQLDELVSNLIQLRYFVNQKASYSYSKNDATVEISDNDGDSDMRTCVWNICNLCEKSKLDLNVRLTLSLVFNTGTGNHTFWYFGGYKAMPRNLEELFDFAYDHGCTFRLTSLSRIWIDETYPIYTKKQVDPNTFPTTNQQFFGTNNSDNVIDLFSMQHHERIPQPENLTNQCVKSIQRPYEKHNKEINMLIHSSYDNINSFKNVGSDPCNAQRIKYDQLKNRECPFTNALLQQKTKK